MIINELILLKLIPNICVCVFRFLLDFEKSEKEKLILKLKDISVA